jgi:hypothetical protein
VIDRWVVHTAPGAAYPEAAVVRTALMAGDWHRCRAMLDNAPPAARTMLMRTLETIGGADVFLGRVLAYDPADTTAAAMLSFHLINTGWHIRTDAGARQVSRRQFAGFHAKLREAEHVLTVALGANAADPALWVAGLTTARGLQHGQADARYRYARLAEIDPHHLPGQNQMLQQLCPKWGGSWEDVHRFGHEAMLAAPAGAPNAVLVVDGHLERWLSDGRRHLKSAAVRDEIKAAAQRSVLHPAFGRDAGWAQTMNTFAMAFGLIGERDSAAAMFTALGPYASDFPWCYQGDEVAAFRRGRAAALGWSRASVADRLLALTSSTAARLMGMAGR